MNATKAPTASHEVASAYKSYLLQASPTLTAADFKSGALIPTQQVDKDITLFETKIAQFIKFGFPYEQEEQQLETLKKYRQSVKGKYWPGAAPCPHKYKVSHTTVSGTLIERCTSCSQMWEQELPNKKNNPLLYVSDGLQELVKSNKSAYQTPTEVKGITLNVGRAQIDQAFIMQMGMASNCNVTIHKSVGVLGTQFMLFCKNCKGTKQFNEQVFVQNGDQLPSVITDFCKEHKHDPRVTDKEGRMFRED